MREHRMTITTRYAQWVELTPEMAEDSVFVAGCERHVTARVLRYCEEHRLRPIEDPMVRLVEQHKRWFDPAPWSHVVLAEMRANGTPPEEPPANWRERLRRFVSAP